MSDYREPDLFIFLGGEGQRARDVHAVVLTNQADALCKKGTCVVHFHPTISIQEGVSYYFESNRFPSSFVLGLHIVPQIQQ